MRFISNPITDILCTIRPNLLTKAISESSYPLPGINSTTFECIRRSFLPWLIRIIKLISYSFSCFSFIKIFIWSQYFRTNQTNFFSCQLSPPPSLYSNQLYYILIHRFSSFLTFFLIVNLILSWCTKLSEFLLLFVTVRWTIVLTATHLNTINWIFII